MSTLKEKLSETIKSSMKSGDKQTLAFARNLYAAVRKKEIDEKITVDDAALQGLVSTSLKQRRDSVEQFKKGGRDDLVAQEEAEIVFLEQFLPPQLSETELRALVQEAVAQTGAKEPKDMGKVMGVLMPKIKGRADGKLVNEIVRSNLSE